jgi:septal ring factor EnvC (AmiA/AmiB activator)
MTKQGITIAVLLAGIIVSMIAWNWNAMADKVQHNHDTSQENSAVIREIKASLEGAQDQREQQTDLLKKMLERMPPAGGASNEPHR